MFDKKSGKIQINYLRRDLLESKLVGLTKLELA